VANNYVRDGDIMQATTTRERVKTGGLCHVAIDVTDLERSLKFYTDLFDMNVGERTDRYIQLKTAGAKDSFFLFKAEGPVNPHGCGLKNFHFGFRIDENNYERAMDYIHKNNIKIYHNPNRAPGHYVYIEDPDGYVIQLEPGDCSG
jgi:catechol 2,3-dioxygenase-like lactoylglutathione lyase family enzyme